MIYNNIDSDSNNNYIRRRGGYYNNYQPHDEIIRIEQEKFGKDIEQLEQEKKEEIKI